MSQILLSTETVTTDAQAQMTLVSTGYTTAKLSFTNPSETSAQFRVQFGIAIVGPETTVEGGATAIIEATGLPVGGAPNLTLKRNEFDTWIDQGNVVSAPTKSIGDVSMSTSSAAAMISWPNTHAATYAIDTFNKTNLSQSLARYSTIPVVDGKNEISFQASNTITYVAQILVLEGGEYHLLKTVEFTPSDLANLSIDAIFATYAELSWDDGDVGQDEADGEAEFRLWRQIRDGSTPWVVLLSWTPDTTKTFTDTGLIPGVEYRYDLQRRGVDGATILQDKNYPFTKTTEITIGEIGSKTLGFNWTSAYDGAEYTYKINGTEVNTSSLAAMVTGLSPDTDYTLEVFIREQGQTILMSSFTQKTDKSGFISLTLAKHTEVSYALHQFSSQTPSTFYVANEDESVRSNDFSTSMSITNMWLRGINPGSTHNLSLFRKENGAWVKQEAGEGLVEHITITTQDASVSTSVATTSAMLQWNEGYDGANYEVNLFYSAPSGSAVVPDEIIQNGDITNSSGLRSAIITGLTMDTPYWATLTVTESNVSNVPEKILLQSFNFDTSAGATLITGEVKASSVFLEWQVGDVNEADGLAEFKLKKQEVSEGTWTDATNWLPHDTNSFANISGLKAGTAYKFELIRMGLDGSEVPQAVVSVSTKTSTLTIAGTASASIQATWTEIYPGASYLLMYTIENGSPETFGGGPISETSALLEGLESSTKYVIELYVMEQGTAVGIATQKLGSSASAETGISKVVVAGAAVVGVAAVGLIVYKIKMAKTVTKALL